MKEWVTPGLETLDVGMTMNSNALNSVIVTTTDDTNPVESSPSNDVTNDDLAGTPEGTGDASGPGGTSEGTGDTSESSDTTEESDNLDTPETEKEKDNPEQSPSTGEESCSPAADAETIADSEAISIFAKEGELFSESSVQDEALIFGGSCDGAVLDPELVLLLGES